MRRLAYTLMLAWMVSLCSGCASLPFGTPEKCKVLEQKYPFWVNCNAGTPDLPIYTCPFYKVVRRDSLAFFGPI